MTLILVSIWLLFAYFNAAFETLFDVPRLRYFFYELRGGLTPELAADAAGRGVLSGLFVLAVITVQEPLRLGATSWFYDLGGADEGEVSDIFLFFESPARYTRALSLTVALLGRRLFWLLLCCLPGALTLGAAQLLSPMLAGMGLLARLPSFIGAFGWALAALGLPAFFVEQNRYALAPYYLFENPALSARQTIRLSVHSTRSHRFAFFLFDLTFAGWFLLTVLALPVLYLYPYYATARGLYARYLITLEARQSEAAQPDVQDDTALI